MEIFLYIVHVLAALSLIVVILLQSGKGGGLGSGFGGAAASATQIFGGGGTTNVLGRATVVIAVIFMSTSLTLAYMSSHENSVMDLDSSNETSFGTNEDQIIEQGEGELVAPDAAAADGDAGGVQIQQVNPDGSPIEVKELQPGSNTVVVGGDDAPAEDAPDENGQADDTSAEEPPAQNP